MGCQSVRRRKHTRMVVRTEIIKGVFDPRGYKKDDPNWAKKRKSEYLMYPLQTFKYTRERTYEVDKFEKEKKEEDDETKEKQAEVKICKDDVWPRLIRSDVTRSYHHR